ncbi:MAG: MotA/TolQ/ExbB proton channel family protein [Chitinispirillaceae bacterium]|nr:MotA/TolQ/ExbB proton channel family protein [Chitinispirillaceae bacterium]
MGILDELGHCFLPEHEAFLFMWALVTLGAVAVIIAVERWFHINRRTDYDAPAFFETIRNLILEKRFEEAVHICSSGGKRALPRILGAGIRKAVIEPKLVTGAMTEESVHMASSMERRLNLLVMFGNVSTLLGLLGTVFGLIMSFAAVGRPGVAPVEKSAMLATGISAAMNATLVGLSISIPCVMVYSWFRARVDMALQEVDRYAIAVLKILNPPSAKERTLTTIGRRTEEEEPADIELTPMLNLMVILIPFLLSSSEFVKIGAIEMKLPEAAAAGGGEGGGGAAVEKAKLDLGIVITAKGFSVFNYFKPESAPAADSGGLSAPDIPLKNGGYDFDALSARLSEVKKKALAQILKAYKPGVAESRSLQELYGDFKGLQVSSLPVFEDHEDVKIVAEEKIQYKTVVAVMDAARGVRTPDGNVTMFPNVAIAGGIVP